MFRSSLRLTILYNSKSQCIENGIADTKVRTGLDTKDRMKNKKVYKNILPHIIKARGEWLEKMCMSNICTVLNA